LFNPYLPSFQDFYTIVLNELVLEVVARHRDDILAQPPDQDYNRDRRHTAYRQYILYNKIYMCIWGKCQWETITSIMLLHTVVDYLPSLQNRCTKL
jgi:hypothetical protein